VLDILEETFQLYLQWNFPAKQLIQQCPIFFGYFLWLHKLFGQQWNFPAKQLIKKYIAEK